MWKSADSQDRWKLGKTMETERNTIFHNIFIHVKKPFQFVSPIKYTLVWVMIVVYTNDLLGNAVHLKIYIFPRRFRKFGLKATSQITI